MSVKDYLFNLHKYSMSTFNWSVKKKTNNLAVLHAVVMGLASIDCEWKFTWCTSTRTLQVNIPKCLLGKQGQLMYKRDCLARSNVFGAQMVAKFKISSEEFKRTLCRDTQASISLQILKLNLLCVLHVLKIYNTSTTFEHVLDDSKRCTHVLSYWESEKHLASSIPPQKIQTRCMVSRYRFNRVIRVLKHSPFAPSHTCTKAL